MITDARVLRPEFIPREVAHRDSEVNQLSNALEPVTRGESAPPVMLFGPSGAGKTCIAQFTLDRLRESVLAVETQYVNCWQNYRTFRCLYRLVDGIGQTVDVHRKSTPTDELLERLERYDGPHYVVVLDEVDQLESKDVLYDLYRIHNVSMVLIANRETELFAQLDDRLVSRLQASPRIRFDRYGLDELVAILADRVRWGLTAGAVDRDQLEHIADAAAGDARTAIGILRNAARQAQRDETGEITDAHVEAAIPEARHELRQQDLDKLTRHQQAVYEIIEEHGEVAPGDLYAGYRERVDDPRSERTIRRYCNKLARYDLIRIEGERRGRSYRLPE
jgi:orc1/cdc6 family replication initiation protein